MNASDIRTVTVARTVVQALCSQLEAVTGQPVELIETHISWVLLSGSLAYKLKKPVRLPFLDYTSLDARRRYCELELRLNRRFSPSLYLEVVPVCGTPDAPRLDGVGEPIDYAVCMRRFAPGALLSEQITAGHLQPAQVEQLARALAAFHRDAPVAERSAAVGSPSQIFKAALDVVDQLQSPDTAESLRTIQDWFAEQARALVPVWLARRAAGAVRECHGDLHLANAVQVGDEVLAFDCIEFNSALRWIDVMSDLAFLTMDLQAHGRPDLAFGALDVYLQHSGDHAGLRVLRFYEVYRALVRAVVARLRPPDASAPDYLGCALRLTRGSPGGPRLMITHGLSGSGKSTLARQLLERAGAIRLRSDVERKRLYGLDALQRSADHDLDLYTPEATRLTFDRLAACARDALRAGYPVIVDAAFLRRGERQTFRALADETGVPFSILHCHASEALLQQRVATRGAAGTDASEADASVLRQQGDWNEPLDAEELVFTIDAATDSDVDADSLCSRWLAVARSTQPASMEWLHTQNKEDSDG